MSDDQPVVAVVVAEGDPLPPGLGPLSDVADVRRAADEAQLAAALSDGAEVLGVWDFRTDLVRRCWGSATGVRWLHAASAGVDAVLLPEVEAAGVTVTNARGVFDRGIAEHVLMCLLAFAKDLPGTLRRQRERTWCHRESETIAGRHLLVVGAGSIGSEVARLARAAGMRVSGVARRARPEDPDFDRVAGVDELGRLLPTADYVAVTAPLNPGTRGLLDADAFAAMRPGARLVNVGRGGVVDESAMLAALEAGHLAGAAMDVFATEPLPADSPLWSREDVIITAHQSGDLHGWQEQLAARFLDNVHRYLAGDSLHDVVSGPEVPR